MRVDVLLGQLSGVRRTGRDRWIAKCPAHDDGRASLSIRELDDGRVLVHDFAGCDVETVLGAVGLEFDALFPDRHIEHGKRERRPFNAHDVLECLAFETSIVLTYASALARGEIGDVDRDRLGVAVGRIEEARRLANG